MGEVSLRKQIKKSHATTRLHMASSKLKLRPARPVGTGASDNLELGTESLSLVLDNGSRATRILAPVARGQELGPRDELPATNSADPAQATSDRRCATSEKASGPSNTPEQSCALADYNAPETFFNFLRGEFSLQGIAPVAKL
jgi:hypothetical protein